jgi:hypothetical protein
MSGHPKRVEAHYDANPQEACSAAITTLIREWRRMRSALYYPHTELRSTFLLKTCLLLWDKVQFIVPYPEYQPGYQNPDVARAIEIIGEQHYPTDAQKEQVHDFIEDFVTRRLPDAFFYREPASKPYVIYEDKFFQKTWDLLYDAQLPGKALGRSHIPMMQSCALAIMSMLADCCAGSTRTRITDRGAAYATVVGLLAGQAKGMVKEPVQPHEQLVPISLSVVNTEAIDLKKLIAFREREAKSGGHAIRDLRHRYVSALETYAQRLATVANNKSDQNEIQRQFEEDMKDDLATLRDELASVRTDALSSNVVVGTVLAGADTIAASFGAKIDLTGALTVTGIPAAIFGAFQISNKYQQSRRAILRNHPMAYMYEFERSR